MDGCYKNGAERHRSGISTRISILMLLLAVLPFMSGCVERKIDGDVILFEYLWWVFPAFLFVGAIGTIGGVVALRGNKGPRIRRLAWAAAIIGPIIALVFPPLVRIPPMELDASGFRLQTGFWFAPQRQELVFDSTEAIEISSSRSVGHRIVETELVCTHSNGSVQRIPVGDQLLQALPDVVTFAKKSGVLIRDLR